MPPMTDLDPIVHGPLRLAVLSMLSKVDRAEFRYLRDKTQSTDGNIGAQLLKLEQAGYIAVEKKFVQRKPVSSYRITRTGRNALAKYVRDLKTLLGNNLGGQR